MAETFNPYPLIGTQLTAGLDAIATDFAGGFSTVDDLVTSIYNYIQPIYYPTSGGAPVPMYLQVEIKSVVYNMINAYNNKALGTTLLYTPQQTNIINMLLGSNTTNLTPLNTLDNWLNDIQDNISKANLNIDLQTPLLLASKVGRSVYSYWNTVIGTPGNWAGLGTFSSDAYRNYVNLALWSAACMEGALIGANASQKGLIAPTTDITSVNIVSALIGALAIGAGKVIFGWVPRIQPIELSLRFASISLNSVMQGNLNPSGGGNSPLGKYYYTPTNGPAGKHSDETCWTESKKASSGWIQDGLYDCVNGSWINEPN